MYVTGFCCSEKMICRRREVVMLLADDGSNCADELLSSS